MQIKKKEPAPILATCVICGHKFHEREMAHVGNEVYKCRECFLGGVK